MIHHLYYEQFIPASIDEVWNFFSDAKNLKQLTSPEMKMKVVSKLGNTQLFEGMKIAYFVSPLFNIPMYWETEIIKVDEKHQFIDIQRKGPFKLWKHTHTFIAVENGVKMIDEIQYQLPLGKFGNLFHQSFVKKNLLELFSYRKQICIQLFK